MTKSEADGPEGNPLTPTEISHKTLVYGEWEDMAS